VLVPEHLIKSVRSERFPGVIRHSNMDNRSTEDKVRARARTKVSDWAEEPNLVHKMQRRKEEQEMEGHGQKI
jgi:hypothetical protein